MSNQVPGFEGIYEQLDEAIAAPGRERNAIAAILQKAEIYGAVYLFAFVTCVVLIFYAGWVRWVAGFFVAACLIAAWSMRSVLADLRRAYAALGRADMVLTRHRAMNAVALLLLGYALFAVWGNWPLPSLAILVAAIINFIHYVGYRSNRRLG